MATPPREGPPFLLPVDSRLIKGMTEEKGPASARSRKAPPYRRTRYDLRELLLVDTGVVSALTKIDEFEPAPGGQLARRLHLPDLLDQVLQPDPPCLGDSLRREPSQHFFSFGSLVVDLLAQEP